MLLIVLLAGCIGCPSSLEYHWHFSLINNRFFVNHLCLAVIEVINQKLVTRFRMKMVIIYLEKKMQTVVSYALNILFLISHLGFDGEECYNSLEIEENLFMLTLMIFFTYVSFHIDQVYSHSVMLGIKPYIICKVIRIQPQFWVVLMILFMLT